MTPGRALQAATTVLLLVLALFSFDGLLLKFEREHARLVPAALAAMLGLALGLRALAVRVEAPRRSRLERFWASLDATGVVWRFDGCGLFFVLGLAALAEWAMRRPAVAMAAAVTPFLVANAILMRETATGRLGTGEGLAADRLMGLHRIGNPFSFPASAVFAWRYGVSPAFYDAIGLRLYNGFTIDMGEEGDDRFLMGGWSGRERGRFGSYRWGIGRRSEIAIALDGLRLIPPGAPRQFRDYVLRFRASPYTFAGDTPQVLAIDINGRRLAERTLDPGFHDYAFDVGPGFLQRSVNVVTLNYAQARSPEGAGRGSDGRPLAVRFDSIQLSPKERS